MKPLTHTQAINALIGDEYQTVKKKRKTERAFNPATLDHSVAFYDPHGSYGEVIVLTTHNLRGRGLINMYITLPIK